MSDIQIQRREVKAIPVFSATGHAPKRYDWSEEGDYENAFDEYSLGYRGDDEPQHPAWGHLKWIAEAYVSGSYEGSGQAVVAWTDGTFSEMSLSHCSCYGPYRDLEKERMVTGDTTREQVNRRIADGDDEHRNALQRAVTRAFCDFPV